MSCSRWCEQPVYRLQHDQRCSKSDTKWAQNRQLHDQVRICLSLYSVPGGLRQIHAQHRCDGEAMHRYFEFQKRFAAMTAAIRLHRALLQKMWDKYEATCRQVCRDCSYVLPAHCMEDTAHCVAAHST